ncbi:MAG TPA: hypothetical protein VJU80_15400, partial [Solirubrobacteraceae bacterium]|nr:hypothetical protein [Solirubrobacteraceae bacterium]
MSLSGRIRTSVVTALVTGVGALFAAGCGLLGTASPAAASSHLQSMFEDSTIEGPNPVDLQDELQTLRYMGVDVLRVGVGWASFTPNANLSVKPPLFNASDPNAYDWGWLRTFVDEAHKFGIGVDLLISGNAPMWASGDPTGTPDGLGSPFEPNAADFGQFVHAVGAEFPTVHFFELWNEANWGPGLTPQSTSGAPPAAKYYRGLANAGYNALTSTGHGHDTISIGNLSQDPGGSGTTGTSAPLTFMKAVYCLSNSYKPLTGSAASALGCSGSRSGFAAANPGLFNVSGVGIHPYPYGNPPTKTLFPNPNGAEFGEIPQMIRSLDKMQRAYGSHKHMAIFNTEYGYRTRPNDTIPYIANPQKAARYINEAEYMSYKNPRIGTYEQYLMFDPIFNKATNTGWFRTGLFFAPHTKACSGTFPCPKPSFYSYRVPVWLPVTNAKHGHALEVWGGVRAARYARTDTGKAQSVQVQFARRGSGKYKTIKTIKLTNKYGYFDTHI